MISLSRLSRAPKRTLAVLVSLAALLLLGWGLRTGGEAPVIKQGSRAAGDTESVAGDRGQDPCLEPLGVECDIAVKSEYDIDSDDLFGHGVALSGDVLAVGMPGEDSCTDDGQGGGDCVNSGAVYVFERRLDEAGRPSWAQAAYLKASNAEAFDWFGYRVALDGDVLAVSALREDSCGAGDQRDDECAGAGAIYVFERRHDEAGRPSWAQTAYLKASDTAPLDGLGSSLALSGDTLAAGTLEDEPVPRRGDEEEPYRHSERVFVFERHRQHDGQSRWTQSAALVSPHTAGTSSGNFAAALALSGDTLAVSAPREGGCGTEDRDDSRCAHSGAVYLFERTEGPGSEASWTDKPPLRLKASNAGEDDDFGGALAMADDVLVVGADGEDSCRTGDQGGDDCTNSGAVYVFERRHDEAGRPSWAQASFLKASDASSGDRFGRDVSLSGDVLVVGADEESRCGGAGAAGLCPGTGAAHVFERVARQGAPPRWRQTARQKAPEADLYDLFGSALSVSGDVLAVGALAEDSCAEGTGGDQSDDGCCNAGAVYVMERPRGAASDQPWGLTSYLKAARLEAGRPAGPVILPGGACVAR